MRKKGDNQPRRKKIVIVEGRVGAKEGECNTDARGSKVTRGSMVYN